MRALELKVPPVAVLLIVGALMLAAAAVSRPLAVPRLWRAAASAALALSSAGIGLVTVGAFRRSGTTVNPLTPDRANALVTTGLYSLSRNPMYVGMLLGLLALAALLANPFSLALCAVFVAYITRFQILPEERMLRARFGEEYERYTRRVRRWA